MLRRSACTFRHHDLERAFHRKDARSDNTVRSAYRGTREKKLYSLRQGRQPLSRARRIAHFIRQFDAMLGDFILKNKTALHFIVTGGQVMRKRGQLLGVHVEL